MDSYAGLDLGEINIRSPTYFIATAASRCGQCGQPTMTVALGVPAGHEILDPEADDVRAAAAWQQGPLPALIFDVHYFSDSVRAQLALCSPHYRPVPNRPNGPNGGVIWLNHCGHCGSAQDEQELHGEADEAFLPMSPKAASTIRLEHIAAQFHGGAAGYSLDPAYFDCMSRS